MPELARAGEEKSSAVEARYRPPHLRETQLYGTVVPCVALGLALEVREELVGRLNQILADTMTIRDLYKKSHWQVSGPTFYQLHLLFDTHHEAQTSLIDALAERIQTLGGVAIAMAADVAETTVIVRREVVNTRALSLSDCSTPIRR